MACEVCGRTPEQNNVRLVAHLATRGDPDVRAIDRLIRDLKTNIQLMN